MPDVENEMRDEGPTFRATLFPAGAEKRVSVGPPAGPPTPLGAPITQSFPGISADVTMSVTVTIEAARAPATVADARRAAPGIGIGIGIGTGISGARHHLRG